MKKVISIICSLIMMLSMSSYAFAYDSTDSITESELLNSIKAEGYLVGTDGTTYAIEGVRVGDPVTISEYNDEVEKSVTYEFDLMSSGLSRENGAYDNTYSVKSYLTLTYSTTGTYNEYIKITSVKGRWTIADSQVSVSGASISCQCSGSVYVNNTTAGAYQAQPYSNSSISNNVSYSTGFSKYVLANASSQINGVMTTNLVRGTSNWNFNVSVTLV